MIDRIFWVEGDWFNNGGTVDEQTYMRRCPMTQHVLETDEHFTGASFQNKQASCIELYRVVRKPQGSGVNGLQAPVIGLHGAGGGGKLWR